MNLTFTPEQQAFRAEVRDWLHEHVPREPLASYDTREGFEQHRAWEAMLAEPGYSALNWPVELGGRGAGLVEWLIFEEEYWAADAPQRVNQNGILLLGPTLMEFGTPEQKARFLPRMARCEDMWAQGWSEPNAGSDMAAITSKAIRTAGPEGEHYVLNGQKIWSTRALFANWLFGLFRSDPSSSRHHGLSYLLVPLDAPGVTIRPIKALNGKQAFAEVFFVTRPAPTGTRPSARPCSRPGWTPRPTTWPVTTPWAAWPRARPSAPRPAPTRSSGASWTWPCTRRPCASSARRPS
jgi:alkylation response protein AidB-like acyl-CoA dehydrogenase